MNVLQGGRSESGAAAGRLLFFGKRVRWCEVEHYIQTELKNEWSSNTTPPMYLSGLAGTILFHVHKRQPQMWKAELLSLLKRSGFFYCTFNIQQFYVLLTQCIYVFCVDLRTNSDYFPIQH